MRSNPTLATTFARNLQLVGLEETAPDPTRGSGSSDMGNVSQVVPALHPSIAIAPRGVAGHSLQFTEYAASAAGMQGQAYATQVMALTLAELFSDPALLAQAAAEFRSGIVA
jgi:metal-dependent amidase/aminoacylase/carboxypeptidase family protein